MAETPHTTETPSGVADGPGGDGASSPSRRAFLKGSATAAFAAAGAGSLIGGAHANGSDKLKVALVGCGGRGTGAASQALSTTGEVQLVAMADAFRNRLDDSHANLAKRFGPDRLDVPDDRKFVGFDAFKKAIDSGPDVVILTTPPGFRPMQFDYAVSQGKHVFMEKPVAVDAAGIRSVLTTAQTAKEKGLKVGVGLQRHHDPKYIETIQRIQNGALGNVVLLRSYWNSGGVWTRPRQPDQTEMQYQMRNWYYFNWLCGDHITEQHIHNLDIANWVMNGPPVRAQGQGGRQVRTGKEHGEIYDHHMVEFTYGDGTKLLSCCRHIQGCWSSVSEHAHGGSGTANIGAGQIKAEGLDWRYRGERVDPYQKEHDHLFAAIREDRPYSEAEYGATSTMTSILGRMATYSGQDIKYEDAINSPQNLMPESFAWDANPPTLPDENGRYPIPMPGTTKPW